jgi:Condensation domain
MSGDARTRPATGSARKRELLALLLRQSGARAGGGGAPGVITRRADSVPCRLSFAQERIWFFEQMEPDTSAYNIPLAVRLIGPLDVDSVGRSLGEIVRRHEALRARFASVEGKPVQSVAQARPLPLPVVDLSGLPPSERERRVQSLNAAESRKPFDLTSGQLLRAVLLRMDETEHVLLMTVHHIASDGWSLMILTRELAAVYEAFAAGRPSPLPEPAVQYTDFARWQREHLQGEVLEKQLSYWTRQLDGAPTTLALPTDRPRPPAQTFNGAKLKEVYPREFADELREFGRRQGATLFMTMLAAYKALLYRYTWQEDILVGTPIANRNRAETEGLIGFFVNTLVLRTKLSGNPSFEDYLAQVRRVTLEAYDHQDVPFEKLVTALRVERDVSRNALFQAFFVFAENPARSVKLSGLTLSPVETHNGLSKFDLELAVLESGDELHVVVLYNVDLFDEATVTRFMAQYRKLLAEVVADPRLRLLDVPLGDEPARAAAAPPAGFQNTDLFAFD